MKSVHGEAETFMLLSSITNTRSRDDPLVDLDIYKETSVFSV